MEAKWKDFTLRVTGDYSGKWLFLAPEYELWIDDQLLDHSGGPRLSPKMEAIFEDEDGSHHHIEASLLSIVGFRPSCEITVEGEPLAAGNVRVQNFLNPFLVIFIIVSTIYMIYVGPDVIRQFFPF